MFGLRCPVSLGMDWLLDNVVASCSVVPGCTCLGLSYITIQGVLRHCQAVCFSPFARFHCAAFPIVVQPHAPFDFSSLFLAGLFTLSRISFGSLESSLEASS